LYLACSANYGGLVRNYLVWHCVGMRNGGQFLREN
jgi:hypothetical protein